jgi:hypothetical protein
VGLVKAVHSVVKMDGERVVGLLVRGVDTNDIKLLKMLKPKTKKQLKP